MHGKQATKYEAIKQAILGEIGAGTYKPGDRLPSEHEIAAAHGVSVITSKRALDELVREGVVRRVKGSGSFVTEAVSGAADDARGATALPRMIAVVLPLGSDTGGSMGLVAGVERYAKQKGYYVSVENTYGSHKRERELLLGLVADGIPGIIYYPAFTAENFDVVKKLSMERFPLVLIDKAIHDIEIDTVLSDNYAGSRAMTEHLVGLGHRAIGFVCDGPIDEKSSLRERFRGYCDALAAAGLGVDIDHVMCPAVDHRLSVDPEERSAFFRSVVDRVQADGGITALQVASDQDAGDLLRICTQRGVRVPETLSITGFDDLAISSYLSPALTTVAQQFELLGKTAAEKLFGRMKHPDRAAEVTVIPVVPRLRSSTGLRRDIAGAD